MRGLEVGHRPEGELQSEDRVAEREEIPRPTRRHGHVADGVFQDEVPADDPRHDLAQGRVGIRVGRTRDRDHRSQFRVAQRREPARDRRDEEGNHDGPGPDPARPRASSEWLSQLWIKLMTGVVHLSRPLWPRLSPAAAVPVSAKMPVPMIAPMPRQVRSNARASASSCPIRLLGFLDEQFGTLGFEKRRTLARPPVYLLCPEGAIPEFRTSGLKTLPRKTAGRPRGGPSSPGAVPGRARRSGPAPPRRPPARR